MCTSSKNKSWGNFFCVTLLTMFFVSVFACAAVWQNYRYQYKKLIVRRIHKQVKMQTSDLPTYGDLHEDEREFRTVSIVGHYLSKKWFFWDDPSHGMQGGYSFMVPFVVDDIRKIILVNLGWILKSDAYSTTTQHCLTDLLDGLANSYNVFGLARKFPAKKWFFSTIVSDNGRLLSRLDGPFLSKSLLLPVDPWQVVVMTPEHCLNTNNQQQLLSIYPEKHLSYAYQWLTFLLISLMIYLRYAYRFFRCISEGSGDKK